MRYLVTGAAGFIGSNLVESLTADNHEVVGVDGFTPYYEREVKEKNLSRLRGHEGFSLVELDLRESSLVDCLDGVDVVVHLAGQPGVRSSWGKEFEDYVGHNIMATQRLLEAARDAGVRRFVYASSSSVYGNAASYPTRETDVTRPFSPYGVTKLSAEHLCGVYAANWDVPTVSLRYFTVYGPRQRPDMAFHRFIEATLAGRALDLYGDGGQRRDFTFVSDVVAATRMAAERESTPGTVLNIAGGSHATIRDVLELIGEAAGTPPLINSLPGVPGDVAETRAECNMAEDVLGWCPTVGLSEGLAAQVAWHRGRLDASDTARG